MPSKHVGIVLGTSILVGFAVACLHQQPPSRDPPEGMVLIPAGVNRGENPLAEGEQYCVAYPRRHDLTSPAFFMDRFEVSRSLWYDVRDWAVTNGYDLNTFATGKGADHPVQTVSWFDCLKWCNARSEKAGRRPVYHVDSSSVYRTGIVRSPTCDESADGYRLPSSDQWEYAARGGLSGRRFPWSDTDTIQHTRANYMSSSTFAYDTSLSRDYHPEFSCHGQPFTSPVGSFEPNPYGLFDMVGNVWEWCFDWYPEREGEQRVARGGDWNGVSYYCRLGYRHGWPPSFILPPYPTFNGGLGLRTVLAIDRTPPTPLRRKRVAYPILQQIDARPR